MIDLQRFCAGPSAKRGYLETPFSSGPYTYASDGQIMVRVPRLDGAREQSAEPHGPEVWERPLKGAATAEYTPFDYDLPEPARRACGNCDGRGREHDCPSCACTCRQCGGSGRLAVQQSCSLGPVAYDLRYLRLLATLPQPEIALGSATAAKPMLLFRFAGGVGCLCGLRGTFNDNTVLAR